MTKLTDLESKVLKNIFESEYHSSIPENAMDTSTWYFCAAGYSIDPKTVRGVVTSLVKKGLVIVFEEKNPDDSTIRMTDEGFKIFKEQLVLVK